MSEDFFVKFAVSPKDLTLTIEEWSEWYLRPAAYQFSRLLRREFWPYASSLVWYRGAYRALR